MKLLIKNFYISEYSKMKEMFGEPGQSFNFDRKTGNYKGLKHLKMIRWGFGQRIGEDSVIFFRHDEDRLLAAITFNSEVIEEDEE